MKKLKNVLLLLVGAALSLFFVPHLGAADAPAVESKLSGDQQAALSTALAEKKSYAVIFKQSVAAGMDCGEVVLFLCKKADNDTAQVYEIVYAAITGGCDAELAAGGALRAGARLQTVFQAAKAAGASRAAIVAAASSNGYTATQISNATPMLSTGVTIGGGGGSGPVGGIPGDSSAVGGGAGNASPFKP